MKCRPFDLESQVKIWDAVNDAVTAARGGRASKTLSADRSKAVVAVNTATTADELAAAIDAYGYACGSKKGVCSPELLAQVSALLPL